MSNLAFIGLYGWLVQIGVYDEIIISHLPPDHSHTGESALPISPLHPGMAF